MTKIKMTKKIQERDYFKSSDLCLISSLCCSGYPIEAIDKSDPSRAVFSIPRNEFLDEILQLYFTHRLKCDPIAFFGFLKEIKTRIYNA